MRYYLDTEFFEDGPTKPVRLISLGIVAQDGREFYAEVEQDLSDVSDWLKANVVPHLTGPRLTREGLAARVLDFVDDAPEFWGYFADYDWVVFCQLFGSMVGLPRHFPQFCRDLKQLADDLRVPRAAYPRQAGTAHNALADARWHRDLYDALRAHERAERHGC